MQLVRESQEVGHLLLKRDDPGLDLLQREVIHCFGGGVGQVGQMRAEICEELPRDDQTDVFIDHCEREARRSRYTQSQREMMMATGRGRNVLASTKAFKDSS